MMHVDMYDLEECFRIVTSKSFLVSVFKAQATKLHSQNFIYSFWYKMKFFSKNLY